MGIDRLEGQTGNLRVILFLYKRKRATITEMLRGIGINQTPLYRSLKILQRLRIIEKIRENGFPPKIFYTITPDARDIARYLLKVEEKLKELQG